MGRKAQPVQVLTEKGQTHLTKAQKEARQAAQLDIGTDRILMPKFVQDEQIAVELWDRLAPDLIEKKLLNNYTCNAFAILCDAWAKYIKASTQVAAEGITIKQINNSGTRDIQNPALLAMTKLGALIKTYCVEFYLTPAALASYERHGRKEQPVDEFAELLGE